MQSQVRSIFDRVRQGSAIIAHERLAIVDPDSGDQPLFNEARRKDAGLTAYTAAI